MPTFAWLFRQLVARRWMVKFIEHRIADRKRILRLIQKWLRAGVSEEGKWSKTEVGTPQGAVGVTAAGQHLPALCIPIYGSGTGESDYRAAGDLIVVRYADDIVMGFENRDEAGAVSPRMEGIRLQSSDWSYIRTRRA